MGLVVGERCFFSVSLLVVGVSRGTAVVMVLGCCWELGMGLLMECFT